MFNNEKIEKIRHVFNDVLQKSGLFLPRLGVQNSKMP